MISLNSKITGDVQQDTKAIPSNVLSFLTGSQVQSNLHIVLSMDVRHPDFEMRLQKNPALLSKCAIFRLDNSSEKGLQDFLRASLVEKYGETLSEETKTSLGHLMLTIHQSMAKGSTSVTSRQFAAFVEDFLSIHETKKADLTSHMLHLQVRHFRPVC